MKSFKNKHLKGLLTSVCLITSLGFISNNSAIAMDKSIAREYRLVDETIDMINEQVNETFDTNIKACVDKYGNKYWANDIKTWGKSLNNQKKLLATAIGETGTDVSYKKEEFVQQIIDTLNEESFTTNEDKQKYVLGLINGLSFYISCLFYYNDLLKDEYFKRVRIARMSGTVAEDYDYYLWKQTLLELYNCLGKNFCKKLEYVSGNWKTLVKHDWYCYCTQYNVFGNIELPEEESKKNGFKNNLPSIIIQVEDYADSFGAAYSERRGFRERRILEDPMKNLYEGYYTNYSSSHHCIRGFDQSENIALFDAYGIVFKVWDGIYPSTLSALSKKLNEDKSFRAKTDKLFKEFLSDLPQDWVENMSVYDKRDYYYRLYGCALAYAVKKADRVLERNIEDFKQCLKLLPFVFPEQIILNITHPNYLGGSPLRIETITAIKNEMLNQNMNDRDYFWGLEDLAVFDILAAYTNNAFKDSELLWYEGDPYDELSEHEEKEFIKKVAVVVSERARKIYDHSHQNVCIARILDDMIFREE